MDQILIS